MLLGDELRTAIKEAYEEARAQAMAEDPPEILEPWDSLPLKMRLASACFQQGASLGRRKHAKEICRPAMVAGDEARRCGREAVMMPKLLRTERGSWASVLWIQWIQWIHTGFASFGRSWRDTNSTAGAIHF